jgi:hypothetical protein
VIKSLPLPKPRSDDADIAGMARKSRAIWPIICWRILWIHVL